MAGRARLGVAWQGEAWQGMARQARIEVSVPGSLAGGPGGVRTIHY